MQFVIPRDIGSTPIAPLKFGSIAQWLERLVEARCMLTAMYICAQGDVAGCS